MKKIITLLFLLISIAFIGCSKIVLKNETVTKVPFKIEKGDYAINLYEIEYPNDIEEKEKFVDDFFVIVKKLIIEEKEKEIKRNINLVLSGDFFDDIQKMESGKLLNKESLYLKTASSISNEEKEVIFSEMGRIDKYKNTVQEILNLQVKYLKQKVSQEDYDETLVYTELDKEEITNVLVQERKLFVKLLKQISIDLIVKADSGKAKSGTEKKEYWYKKNKSVQGSGGVFSENIKKYSKNVIYVSDIQDSKISLIYDGVADLPAKVMIIENTEYSGYIHTPSSKNYVFFVGGKNNYSEYEGYNFNIVKQNVKLIDLISINNDILISEVVGGK